MTTSHTHNKLPHSGPSERQRRERRKTTLSLHTLHEIQRSLPLHNINTTRLVRVANTVAPIRHMHHLRPERRTDELAASILILASVPTQPLQHLRHSRAILRIEIGIDFIKQVEWRWVALLDRKDEGECAEGFLTAGELADLLLLVVFAVEGYGDADAGVFFHLALLALRLFFVHVVVVGGHVAADVAVGFAVDDQAAATDGHELLEDFSESGGDLLEGAGDGFVFALVEYVNEVLDGFARSIELGAAIGESAALACKVLVLFEGFLVDVGEALEGLVGLGELFGDLSLC
jgi:hypothetical protein